MCGCLAIAQISFPGNVFTGPLLSNGCLFICLLHSNDCTRFLRGLCLATGLYATKWNKFRKMISQWNWSVFLLSFPVCLKYPYEKAMYIFSKPVLNLLFWKWHKSRYNGCNSVKSKEPFDLIGLLIKNDKLLMRLVALILGLCADFIDLSPREFMK
jgi:hypothetical protein